MKTLVTGGAGFIGSHIVERLCARGHEVVVIDDLSTGMATNMPNGVRFVHLDIAASETSAMVATIRPDAVVHCAAQPSVSVSVRDPVLDARVNIIGGVNIVTGAIAGGTARFVFINTGGALYGQTAHIPSDENERVAPMSPYGLSKSVLERYLELLAPEPAWWTSLRLANVYGPRQRPDGEAGVVSIFIQHMIRGLPIEIHGDGEQTRDFVYVGDVTDAVELALNQPVHAILNVGTGIQTSVEELFHRIAGKTGYEVPPVRAAMRAGDVHDSALDPSLARQTLGWASKTTLNEGLDRTIAWHRATERTLK